MTPQPKAAAPAQKKTVKAVPVKVAAKPKAVKPAVKAAARPAAKPGAKPTVRPTAKSAAKAAAKAPAKKAAAKPVAKKVAKAVAKSPVKSPAKPTGKAAKPAKPAPKPVAKPAKNAVKSPAKAAKAPAKKSVPAKAAPKTATKAAPKVAAKAAAPSKSQKPPTQKPAARKTTATPPVAQPAKGREAGAARSAAPAGAVRATAKAAAATPAVAASSAPSNVAAPVATPGLPPRATKPSARLAQITVPSMAQAVASNAAKASYFPTVSQPVTSPAYVAVKKDPKLANNWKAKPADQLSDAEVLAMPDAEYMNDKQLAFFRLKLAQLKQDILNSAGETTEHLREDTVIVPDPADRATIEEEHALELRTRDRERKLLKKISQALVRIDNGEYGFCDETGEPIGLGRLLARPTATLSLEAQQRRELKQKMFGD